MKTLILFGFIFSILWQIVDTPELRGSAHELAHEIYEDGIEGECF